MKIGSLFSGIGGIELGFEKVGGFETAWFVEKEPYCQAILKKHWPNVPIYGDITKVNFKEVEQVDIITGGFPCQDISNAGQRKGIGGERSSLWKEFWRAICEIRPKYAFVENVSALTYRGLLTVLGDLAEIGYNAEWNCLPASAIGASHRRDRIYILAYPNDNGFIHRQTKKQSTKRGKFAQRNTSTKGNVANTNKQSIQRGHKKEYFGRESKTKIGRRSNFVSNSLHFDNWKQRKESLREKNRRETWATDTGILRVANGIPNRIHRIKSIGNAVVPQCAEFFAEIIKEKEVNNGGIEYG